MSRVASNARPWPGRVDYVDAMQDAAATLAPPHLRAAEVEQDFMGMPTGVSGQNAIVFRLVTDDGPVALRCLTTEPSEGQLRYEALLRHLEQSPCRHLIPARWHDAGIIVGGVTWPVVEMPWVPGRPMDVIVDDLVSSGQAERIHVLADRWLEAVDDLGRAEVAHGDLQHGNALIDDALSISFVDLDGVWFPAVQDHASREVGHANYQHPRRSDERPWGPRLDTFAALVIYLSLRAVAEEPGLWSAHHDSDALVFKKHDLERAGATPLWSALASSPCEEVRVLTGLLQELCRRPAATTADLGTIVRTRALPPAPVGYVPPSTVNDWWTDPIDPGATSVTPWGQEAPREEETFAGSADRFGSGGRASHEPGRPCGPCVADAGERCTGVGGGVHGERRLVRRDGTAVLLAGLPRVRWRAGARPAGRWSTP
jgi:eukaryotic-like serine/threonine-protein kinase